MKIEEGIFINIFIMSVVIIYLASTVFYYNSKAFIKKELAKRNLVFLERIKIDINEKNPFTGLRNNDIRKMHYDKDWLPAVCYYDKILCLENDKEVESWIKVSFMVIGISQLVFIEDVYPLR